MKRREKRKGEKVVGGLGQYVISIALSKSTGLVDDGASV